MQKKTSTFLYGQKGKKGIMKEKAATFSFDNPKCLSAINMIILNSKKINRKMEEIIKNYKNMLNYGYLKCPACNSSNVIKWGTYERGIIYFNESNILESTIIKIQRIKCKCCGKTHALLPLGIIPYKQFSSDVVADVLLANQTLSTFATSDKYNISEKIILRWNKDFKKYHLSRLKVQTKTNDLKIMLSLINEKVEEKTKYIEIYNRCFMQVKLGVIGLSPS